MVSRGLRTGALAAAFTLAIVASGCLASAPATVATPIPAPTATAAPTAIPSPPAAPSVTSTPTPQRVSLDLSVAARRVPIILRLSEASLIGDRLTLAVEFVNAGARDLQGPTGASGEDAVLVADGLPQQPQDVTPSLADDIAPVGRWNAGAANRGDLVFQRPQGDLATLRLPGFPPVQIDLRAGSARALADDGGFLPTPTPDPAAEAVVGARAALARLVAAIRARDSGQFNAATTATAREFFRDVTDPLAFARTVPFSRFEMDLFPNDPEAMGKLILAEGRATRLTDVPVALIYAFQGTDSEWFRHVLTVDFERTPGGWRVSDIRAERPPFWTVGLTATTRSPHFLVFHRTGHDAASIIEAAEKAHAGLSARLGDIVDPLHVLVVVDDRDLFTQVTQQSGHSFVGSARYDNLLTNTGIRVTSRALFINEGAFANGGLANRRDQTIMHELAHLALSRWTRPWSPPWLVEGAAGLFAEETSYTALAAYRREQGVAAVGLADLVGLETLDQSPVPLLVAYAYSTFVAETIVEEFGQDRYLDLYRAFADVSMDRVHQAAGDSLSVAPERFRDMQRGVSDEVLPRVLDIDAAELEARVAARMAQKLGQ